MAQNLKIYLSQINNSVGDLQHNQHLITDQCLIAEQQNCDLIIFPEMTISGYPCEDLWKKKIFC